jgi:hypothetical protein
VDFATESLNVRLKPRPKTPQFFSLATPVEVNGSLTDFKIGVRGSDLLDTTARLLSSLVTVPLQWLTEGRLPRDGGDVCGANALRGTVAR